MFKPVSSKVDFPSLEERILAFWREREVFRRTWDERGGAPLFVLYEGPPTANGSPGIHHVLARVYKDVIPRFKTMKGYRVLRKGGWDTHGLPVELEVEKELGISTKPEIETYGIERFNARCRESVFRYVKEWEAMTERVAFWIDMKHAYVTCENDYIESVWWILRQLWDAGLIYRGVKSAPHCPRCVTTLSSHEVALGYQENTPDPSVYVQFRVVGGESPLARELASGGAPVYILAWTTTPWTLPGNTALAVHPQAEYSLVEVEKDGKKERLVLATKLLGSALVGDYTVLHGGIRGEALEGLRYEPLYDPFRYEAAWPTPSIHNQPDTIVRLRPDGGASLGRRDSFPGTYPVITSDFVTLEDGTGVVHIAPAFGQEDYEAGLQHGLYFVQHVDLQGKVLGRYPFAGKFVKEADPLVMEDLAQRGLLYGRGVYHHTYPFCWRCDAPLLYYAKPSWYIRTTEVKDRLVSANQEINWFPEHVKEGRFGEWLRNNVDWAISRERYWGTPIPLWGHPTPDALQYHYQMGGDEEDAYLCVGSREELEGLAVKEDKARVSSLDLHRPYVDAIQVRCPTCGEAMRRIPEVMDCWFDSGAMPLAQFHYPLENATAPQDGRYPGDYICEAVDQTRGWFYSLHAVATLLEKATGGKVTAPSFRNVICLGLVMDEKGDKMSKSRGNVVNPWDLLRAHGADALRWYLYTASAPGNSRRFSAGQVEEVVRRFHLILWNTYSFFVTYANLDGFDPSASPKVMPTSDLDRWVLSELNMLVGEVSQLLDSYNPTDAGRRIEGFVDMLSTWYVRRSRRRFWKSENDEDKLSAYHTLYSCLVTLARLLAPFTPFLAEELYQNLVRSVDQDAPESVHLDRFPDADPSRIDPALSEATQIARRLVSMGRAARSKARIRVRQPLPLLVVKVRTPQEASALGRVEEQLVEELNVRRVQLLEDEREVVQFRVRPNMAALGRKHGARAREVARLVGEVDPQEVEAKARSGQEIQVGDYRVAPEDLNVDMIVKEGFSAVSEGGYTVAVSTQVTPDLLQEGMAREVVHRLQGMRRAAGFDIADRITSFCQGPQEVTAAVERFREYIQQETLSSQLVLATPPDGAYVERHQIEEREVTLGVQPI